MKAIVLAGGFGTRIQPLTHSVPKPMLNILNRPMMQHIIERLRDAGIIDIVILLYFKPDIVKNYFGDGSAFGVNINYVLPDDDYGTAGAVKKAEEFLQGEEFMIVSGDLVTDFDFNEIIAFHKKKESKLTITLTPVDDPLQFGVVITAPDGKIQKFLEKPSWSEVFSDTINTGIYILAPEILNYIPANTNYDFGKELFPALMKDNVTLWGPILHGYWRDVGNPESYRDVQKDIMDGKVKLSFRGKANSVGSAVIHVEDGVVIEDGAIFDGVVTLGKGAVVRRGAKIQNSVIGQNSEIGEGSIVSDCTIWENVTVGQKCQIENSVICDKVQIDREVHITQGAIIAEATEIGAMTSFENDVIVWPEKIIEEASIVSNNIVWGSKYKNSIFEGGVVRGRTNVELSCEMATKLGEAFGAMLPVGSKVYLSRDYHKSSRMLKRAFLSGLMSSGINVIDIKVCPSNVTRFGISKQDDILAGAHFRQSTSDQISTEILFFTNEGLYIDTNTEKNCERIFFRESFRRVNFQDIGFITEKTDLKSAYIGNFLSCVHKDIFATNASKVVIDLLYGSTSDVFPDIVNQLAIENIIMNAYEDDRKLNKINEITKKSEENLSKIVTTMAYDLGFMIYPNGQRLEIISDVGGMLPNYQALLVILKLINDTATENKKVFLPVSAPDFMDAQFGNLTIERGKFTGFKASKLGEYSFVGSIGANYCFTDFTLNYDSLFASIKILEMLATAQQKISEVVGSLKQFYFEGQVVDCPSSFKGKMMRKFMEASVGKEASFVDGVKIALGTSEWILMLPDQHLECLHLYVQACNEVKGKEIFDEYKAKIAEWISE
jgi:mannose-1-phosphate guanylyltransferase / phosphomannomutase